MCSDDQLLAIDNLVDVPNVIFAGKNAKETDMDVLTMCDHVLLIMGTFGWWGAFLGDSKKKSSPGYLVSSEQDEIRKNFYLPTWTPITNPAENMFIPDQNSP